MIELAIYYDALLFLLDMEETPLEPGATAD